MFTRSLFFGIFLFVEVGAAVVLKTAAQESSPKYIQVQTPSKSEIQGYCVDILRSLEKIDPQLKFEGDQKIIPFPRMQSLLERGAIDVFCGIQKNRSREKKFIFFEEPILYLQGKLVVLTEDIVAPTSWVEVAAVKGPPTVLTIKGTASAAYLTKNTKGLVVDDSPMAIDQALQMLLKKRGRFVFYHDLAIIDSIHRLSLEKKVRILPTDFYSEGQYFAVSKDLDPTQLRRLRAAYKKLHTSGKIGEILTKYPVIRAENLSPRAEKIESSVFD